MSIDLQSGATGHKEYGSSLQVKVSVKVTETVCNSKTLVILLKIRLFKV